MLNIPTSARITVSNIQGTSRTTTATATRNTLFTGRAVRRTRPASARTQQSPRSFLLRGLARLRARLFRHQSEPPRSDPDERDKAEALSDKLESVLDTLIQHRPRRSKKHAIKPEQTLPDPPSELAQSLNALAALREHLGHERHQLYNAILSARAKRYVAALAPEKRADLLNTISLWRNLHSTACESTMDSISDASLALLVEEASETLRGPLDHVIEQTAPFAGDTGSARRTLDSDALHPMQTTAQQLLDTHGYEILPEAERTTLAHGLMKLMMLPGPSSPKQDERAHLLEFLPDRTLNHFLALADLPARGESAVNAYAEMNARVNVAITDILNKRLSELDRPRVYTESKEVFRSAIDETLERGLPGLLGTLGQRGTHLLQADDPTRPGASFLGPATGQLRADAAFEAVASLTDQALQTLITVLDSHAADTLYTIMLSAADVHGTMPEQDTQKEERTLRNCCANLALLRSTARNDAINRGLQIVDGNEDTLSEDTALFMIRHGLGIFVGRHGDAFRVEARPVAPALRNALQRNLAALLKRVNGTFFSTRTGGALHFNTDSTKVPEEQAFTRWLANSIHQHTVRYLSRETGQLATLGHAESHTETIRSDISRSLREIASRNPGALTLLSRLLSHELDHAYAMTVRHRPQINPVNVYNGASVMTGNTRSIFTILPHENGGMTILCDVHTDNATVLTSGHTPEPTILMPAHSYQRASYGVHITPEGTMEPADEILEGHHTVIANTERTEPVDHHNP